EINLLLVVIIFKHREIDDPAEAECVLFDQVELFGDASARRASELCRVGLLACREEDAVIRTKAHRDREPVHALVPVVLGNGSAPLAAFARRITETGEALAPRPFIHVVEEFAALLGGAGRRDCAYDGPLLH